MKLCNSPANTYCTYQRIARDQSPTDEPDNTAQAGAASQAYADLFQHLGDDAEGQAMLKHLMNCLSGSGAAAMDQPPPFAPRPTASAMDADLRRRVAIGRQVTARKFAERFPGASRIQVIG
jgi:hypothetical protein